MMNNNNRQNHQWRVFTGAAGAAADGLDLVGWYPVQHMLYLPGTYLPER